LTRCRSIWSKLRDLTGSYATAYTISAVMLLGGAVLALTARSTSRPG
jgi:hypothetical protein